MYRPSQPISSSPSGIPRHHLRTLPSFARVPAVPILSRTTTFTPLGTPTRHHTGSFPSSFTHTPNTNAGLIPINSPLSPSEWSIFGVEIPIKGLSALAEVEFERGSGHSTSDSTQSISSIGAGGFVAGDLANGRKSTHEDRELFSYAFGADRWKIEIAKPVGKTTESLTLFLFFDVHYSHNHPTSLMFGIKEPKGSAKRGRESWVWQEWEPNWCFSPESDCYELTSFPLFSQLLKNPQLAAEDSLILSIQIQSPILDNCPIPEVQGAHHIPLNLFKGLSKLLDDKSTADVVIYTYENQRSEDDSRRIRKRAIYAHKSILMARSIFFQDMLSDGVWKESLGEKSEEEAIDGRRCAVVKIEDFDIVTVYWMLHYLYTNDIIFQEIEDIRLSPPHDLPEDWLATHFSLSWGWHDLEQFSTIPDSMANTVEDENEVEPAPDGFTSPTQSIFDATLSTTPTHSVSDQTKEGRISPSALTIASKKSSPSTAASNTTVLADRGKKSQLPIRAFQLNTGYNRPQKSESISNPTTMSATNSISSNTNFNAITSRPTSSLKPVFDSEELFHDPHPHPMQLDTPASALSVYSLAHRCGMSDLARIALDHINATLTPKTAFPMLLSTHLWPDLHAVVKNYVLTNYYEICREPEFGRCFDEVGRGMWDHGGEVLFNLTLSLSPSWSN